MSHLRRLVAELRRRKVFRVTGVYVVAAAATLQVADVVVEPLSLPDGTMTLLIVLAAVGLPIAAALAWTFDLTAAGLERTGPAPASGSSAGSSHSPAFVALAILIGLVAVGTYAFVGPLRGGDGGTLDSVAVLPFVNMSDDPSNEYFSDGITEELLDALAGVPGLRVPARTSSFQFKGERTDVREVGRALDVQTVLEGSVRKAGERVRITAQLINAETGYHLWSETYDRELRDIFAVQTEIAAAIVEALRLELASGDVPLAAATTASIEAHDLYLLGRFHFHRRDLLEAERQFRAAIAADPDYGEAQGGLALTYAVLPLFDSGTTVQQATREGKAAARRALALEPALPDAHAALGQIAQNYEWDWDAAERHYTRAIELAPNDPNVRQWRAEVLVVRGDSDAVAGVEAALALDPLSPIANSVTAMTHLFISRDYDRSAQLWRRVEDLDPAFPLLRDFSVHTDIARGDWDEARRRLFHLAATPADSQAFAAWVDAAAAVRRGETPSAAARERARDAAHRYGRLVNLGDVGAAILLGPVDPDGALELIDDARHDPRYRHPLSWVGRYWFFDGLHEDPRYRRLLRALGLPQ